MDNQKNLVDSNEVDSKESKPLTLNRKQRRAYRKHRGHGLTRQYSSKRARDLHGRSQRKVSMSELEFEKLLEMLRKQTTEAKNLIELTKNSVEVLNTESQYTDTFDLIPDLDQEDSIADPQLHLTQKVSDSNVKQALELITKGDCDLCLENVRIAEIANKNRVSVLKAIDSRLRKVNV